MRGVETFCWGLCVMAISLTWKVGAAVVGVLAAVLVGNGFSRYLERRHADELVLDYARTAQVDAQLAKARGEQRSAELAATLQRRRAEMANTYREVGEQAAHYQVQLGKRQQAQRQEAARVQASYRLGPNQNCADGIVINRSASSFTQAVGAGGKPIPCKGNIAAQPLR